jgi:hypothetical protein
VLRIQLPRVALGDYNDSKFRCLGLQCAHRQRAESWL